jgi:hypothetical protein
MRDSFLRPLAIPFESHWDAGRERDEVQGQSRKLPAIFLDPCAVDDDIINNRDEILLCKRTRQTTLIAHIEMDLVFLFLGRLTTRRDAAGNNELLQPVAFDVDSPWKAGCQRAGGGRLSRARDAVDDPDFSHDENPL